MLAFLLSHMSPLLALLLEPFAAELEFEDYGHSCEMVEPFDRSCSNTSTAERYSGDERADAMLKFIFVHVT